MGTGSDVDGLRQAGNMAAEVANVGGFGMAAIDIPPSGSAGIVTTDDYTLFGASSNIGNPVDIRSRSNFGGISSSEIGGIAGTLKKLFKGISLNFGNIHTHKAAKNQFVAGQRRGCSSGVANDISKKFRSSSAINTGNMVFVDAGVHEFAEADLLEFADAVGAAGAFTGGGEGGQQHGSQNRDDSDYHQSRIQREKRYEVLARASVKPLPAGVRMVIGKQNCDQG